MCFTNSICVFGWSLSLTDSFQNLLKTRINCTKLRIQWMSKYCLRGVAEKGGKMWEWGKSAMVVRGDRRPWVRFQCIVVRAAAIKNKAVSLSLVLLAIRAINVAQRSASQSVHWPLSDPPWPQDEPRCPLTTWVGQASTMTLMVMVVLLLKKSLYYYGASRMAKLVYVTW